MERRNCQIVIRSMQSEIPDSEVEFKKALDWNFEDAGYKAPEETLQWERTMQTLKKYISLPKQEWEFEVISIFTTRPIDQLKKAIKKIIK